MNQLKQAPSEDTLFNEAPEPFRAWLRKDLGRYIDLDENPGRLQLARCILGQEGLWAVAVYRARRYLWTRRNERRGFFGRLRFALLGFVVAWLEFWVRMFLDIHLDARAEIAPGFFVGHFKSIHVGAGVRIGRDCNIGQMCFVSAAGPGFRAGAPVIGERVYLGVGCKVMGPVRVGSDVAIGANAVVLEDLPDFAVAVGNPAQVVSMRGSGSFISVKLRDADPVRLDRGGPVASA